MKIFLVPPVEVDYLWDELKPLIDKAFRYQQHIKADDLQTLIKNSRMYAWIITEGDSIEAVFLCEFIHYPRKKSCYINAWSTKSGYDFDKYYKPTITEIENFAKINGADFIEAQVRKGLAKKLKADGWEDNQSLVTRTLFKEEHHG